MTFSALMSGQILILTSFYHDLFFTFHDDRQCLEGYFCVILMWDNVRDAYQIQYIVVDIIMTTVEQ